MMWTIDDPEIERLASELAELTGETTEVAIRGSLQEYRDRLLKQRDKGLIPNARDDDTDG